ncbi:hypothetical protein H2199_001790 [Coniosporium tulheliwenetii]|uniref:Uncharacterized protein n=1 Tax=Coniosporium tulheliwenetii TaxID=3383036 RepID=A0ACC2ZKK0_9PEZI|nr:hypothetical protein H2199_001790 [Cladosporium sp. JES 115]
MSAEAPKSTIAGTPAVSEPVTLQSAETTIGQSSTSAAPAVDGAASTDAANTTGALQGETAATDATKNAVEPIYSGALKYKAPGLVNSFLGSKKYFWFGDEAVSAQNLSSYLRGEKAEVAHPTAAWSSQTGKGLLYFAKHPTDKATPAGVLNLADASDLTKEGFEIFSFRIHGQKHTFEAKTIIERDGWFLAMEKTMEEAKAAKDGILSSEGYKESISQLGKPAALAGASHAAASSTPRKSIDALKPTDGPARRGSASSSSSSDVNGTKKSKKSKSKSRSISRGKRASIFGSLMGKKEEHDVKKAEKHEDTPAMPAVVDTTKADAPVVAGTTASIDAHAIATTTTEGIAEATEPKSTTTAPKPTKRGSVFGTLFEKVRSPVHEKKESEVAPTVPPKDTETPVTAPITETNEPLTSAAPTETTTTSAAATTPHKERENFFGKFLGKREAKSPAAEVPPAIPTTEKATETPAAAPIVSPAVEERATDVPANGAATNVHSTATPESKDKRRTSFFGNLTGSVKKDKKPDNHAEGESPVETEHKQSGVSKLGGLFRNPSKAMKSNKETKKDVTPPSMVEEGSEAPVLPAPTSVTAAHGGTDGPIGTDEITPAGQTSLGNVNGNGVHNGQTPPQSTPAVHATA